MTTYYKIVKGLGKNDIGIAGFACLGCKKVGITLYTVKNKGKKAYACGDCKKLYKSWKKGGKNGNN